MSGMEPLSIESILFYGSAFDFSSDIHFFVRIMCDLDAEHIKLATAKSEAAAKAKKTAPKQRSRK